MTFFSWFAAIALVIPSAPQSKPEIRLQIDNKPVVLSDPRIQSATATSGRPTFVVMGDLGDETVFIRCTIPQAKPGSYPVRVMRVRPDGEPKASLNIDSRPTSGLPLLRPNGGTLEIQGIEIGEHELISQLKAEFNGRMSVSDGATHEVVLSVEWNSTEPNP